MTWRPSPVGSSVPQWAEYFLWYRPLGSVLAPEVHRYTKFTGFSLRLAAGAQVFGSGHQGGVQPLGSSLSFSHSVREARTYLIPPLSCSHGSCRSLHPFRGRGQCANRQGMWWPPSFQWLHGNPSLSFRPYPLSPC